MELVLQLLVNGLAVGAHYALIGIGFGLIFSTTRILHFSYAPIYAVAAYAAWAGATMLGLPLPLAILFGVIVAAIAGSLTYQFLYRPFETDGADLRTQRVMLIASLGLFIALENLIGIVFNTDTKTIPDLQPSIYFLGDVVFTSVHVLHVIALLLIGGALGLFLRLTSYGKRVLAMADNVRMARIIGIDTHRVSLLVFAIGSAISAVPAILTLVQDGAQPHMGFDAVFAAFVVVVVGGIGSMKGAVVGGLLLGLVQNLGMLKIATEWQDSISFFMLFAILLARPSGLFRSVR